MRIRRANHNDVLLTGVISCALMLSACSPQFNAAPKKAKVADVPKPAVTADIVQGPVDRRIRLGGVPANAAGAALSGNLQIVSSEVAVKGSNVGAKLSISN